MYHSQFDIEDSRASFLLLRTTCMWNLLFVRNYACFEKSTKQNQQDLIINNN